MNQEIFGGALTLDPTVALPTVHFEVPAETGPVHKTQFVIEVVGPRTVPAPSVQALLQPHWQQALGNPQIFVMAGMDAHWRSLLPGDGSGAYDSVALAWDLISPRGELSVATAQALWNAAEDFAKQVQRRALATPIPQDVPQNIHALEEMRDSFDVGFNLSVVSSWEAFPEKEIWRVAAALGLEYGPQGTFLWKPSGPEPLFEVSPGEGYDRFSLAQVQSGVTHAAIGLGFSVPVNPDPMAALEGCFQAGTVLAKRLNGTLLDEDDQPVSWTSRSSYEKNLGLAVDAMRKAGFAPGSVEALKLFAG